MSYQSKIISTALFPYVSAIVSVFYCLFILITFWGCEKDIDIKLSEGTEKMVVEGHIEPGLPPYVILTKSQPYFSSVDVNDLSEIFVHDAIVKVSDGADTVLLTEVSSENIPKDILSIISEQIGFTLAGKSDTIGLKVYVYISLDPRMLGETGKTYKLNISKGDQILTSATTIPAAPKIDSAWAIPHPANDTLAILNIRYSDPAGERNFIRYFTSTNYRPFYPPFFQSIFDDQSIFDVDGKTFDLPIQKGHNRTRAINFDTFTYFTKGDSVIIRWCAIDQEHYDFWQTAEYDRGSTGNPFSSPIKIKSNIEGGMGIWGGYSPFYYNINIPE